MVATFTKPSRFLSKLAPWTLRKPYGLRLSKILKEHRMGDFKDDHIKYPTNYVTVTR